MRLNSLCLSAGLLLGLGSSAPAATTRYVNADNPSPAIPYTTWATAATNIQVAIDAAVAGDEILVTNGVYEVGAAAVYAMSNRVAVTKPVTVRSVNGPLVTSIVGYQVPGVTNGDAAVRCVYLTNGAVLAGFTLTNGATQASGDVLTNQAGGGVWCESVSAVVSNCVLTGNSARYYGGGAYSGALNNCTVSGNSAFDAGGGAYNATLDNCTLSGNLAAQYGGGAIYGTFISCTLNSNSAYMGGGTYGGTLSNCMVMHNSASFYGGGTSAGTLINCMLKSNSAYSGGGAFDATLRNCALISNSARSGGGAALGGVSGHHLDNCTLTGNSATSGGGVYSCTLRNCILYYNTAASGGNYFSGSALNYCCTTPLPAGGVGNTAAEPLLVSTNGWSNLRPRAGSPCINAGVNAYASVPADLDGNPRIVAGTVDIGAYEFQFPSVTPPQLAAPVVSADGTLQLAFTNAAGAAFEVLGTTNVATPLGNWTALGAAAEGPAGQYHFADPAPLTNQQRFYRVRAP